MYVIQFDFDKYDVRSDAVQTLAKLAHVLIQKAADIVVIGHTDSKGGDQYNKDLSGRRAISVMFWLNQNENIPANLMKAKGLGESQPAAFKTMSDGSDNPECWAKNRRVEVILSVNQG